MSLEPAWERRFTATRSDFPAWSDAVPDRLALVTNRSGASQVWTYDLGDGSWRQVTDEPVGIEHVMVAPDGRLVWWLDATGNERGHWVARPSTAANRDRWCVVFPTRGRMGISMVGGRVAVGSRPTTTTGCTSRTATRKRAGLPARAPAGVGANGPKGSGVSRRRDPALHPAWEHGDILRSALRVLDAENGQPVGDLVDQARRLEAVAWSPRGHLLAFVSEMGPFERPGLWDLDSGERRDLTLPTLPGAAWPVAWYADASALLVRHEHEGRSQLVRVNVDDETTDVDRRSRRRDRGRRDPAGRTGVVRHEQRDRPTQDRRPRAVCPSSRSRTNRHRPGRRCAASGSTIRTAIASTRSCSRPRGRVRSPRPVGPRRTGVARAPRVGRRGPGLRRRGLRGREAQLPRLHRLRGRVP